MSPSWRDRVVVHVARDTVRLRRHARGWRPAPQAVVEAPCDAVDPVSLRAALQLLLPSAGKRRPRVSVVLSNDLVRLAMLEGVDELEGSAERASAARHRLRAIFGPLADGWRSVVDAGPGVTHGVVAAVNGDLLDGLLEGAQAAGLHIDRIEPWFAVASRGCRVPSNTDLFVVAEPAKVVVARLRDDHIVALRGVRLGGELVDELPRLLDKMQLLEGTERSGGNVTVVSAAGTPAEFPAHPTWRIAGVSFDPTALAVGGRS